MQSQPDAPSSPASGGGGVGGGVEGGLDAGSSVGADGGERGISIGEVRASDAYETQLANEAASLNIHAEDLVARRLASLADLCLDDDGLDHPEDIFAANSAQHKRHGGAGLLANLRNTLRGSLTDMHGSLHDMRHSFMRHSTRLTTRERRPKGGATAPKDRGNSRLGRLRLRAPPSVKLPTQPPPQRLPPPSVLTSVTKAGGAQPKPGASTTESKQGTGKKMNRPERKWSVLPQTPAAPTQPERKWSVLPDEGKAPMKPARPRGPSVARMPTHDGPKEGGLGNTLTVVAETRLRL